MTIFKRKTPVRIIYWRALALLLSWALLAIFLRLINLKSPHLDLATWGALVIASTCYLLVTLLILKPINTK
jgi:hypothetical protein